LYTSLESRRERRAGRRAERAQHAAGERATVPV
ncbi:MAG: hypothetical protein JWQ26_2985, partial [Modestobacter sp.]|nr:hypothetical protein [Modestobacter sp.]